MTGPAHVPDTLLKGGGAAFFDAACVAALAKCGYSPEDFGTYSDVRERIKQKRAECDLHDDFHRDPQGPPPGCTGRQREDRQRALDRHVAENGQSPPPEPTPEDRRMARSQSGHLTQNATQQSLRGDVCSNPPSCRHTYVPPRYRGENNVQAVAGGGFRSDFVSGGCNGTPGYISEDAPCMPHEGQAARDGTGHNHVTCGECDAASSQSARPGEREVDRPNRWGGPGSAYGRDEEARDADARTESLLREHGNGLPPPSEETAAGTSADQADPDPSDAAATASGADAGADTDPSAGAKDSDAVSKAADCINQYRKAAQMEMAERCAESSDSYADAAGTAAERQQLLADRDAAQRRVDELEGQDNPNPDDLRRARGERNAAAAAHNSAQRNACLAEQSAALRREGGVPGDARTPSLYRPPPNWAEPQGQSDSTSAATGDV